MPTLAEQARALPVEPGVYLFRDPRKRVLYVGKAKSLRTRVGQYLSGQDERTMVPFLVSAAATVDFVVTSTEKEALLLENSLIKKHRPRFNVKLRDDSNFLHLRIDAAEPWPAFHLVRRIRKDRARYFGPFHSATRARKTLDFLHRAFGLRTCSDAVLRSRTRPCLLYQMGRCTAPCVGLVTPEAYAEDVESATWFLQGKRAPVVERLEQKMREASEALRYERAAHYRDLVRDVTATVERQHVVDPALADRDVWGIYREGSRGVLAILAVREGVVGEPRALTLPALVGDDGEVLSSLVNAVYGEDAYLVPEILLPWLPDDLSALEELLGERRGGRVQILVPQRGDKARVLALAYENAKLRFERENDEGTRVRLKLEELARVLELPEPPRRIECFDNSHLQGNDPVAAMAVLVDGVPARDEYRRYSLRDTPPGDDYAAMREVLSRRFQRALEEGGRPDLLVVDGGKGQLGVAVSVLQDLGVHDQAVVGIAKPDGEHRKGALDRLVLPHRKDPLRLGPHSPALRIVQNVRDEAHRHALHYQRKVRDRKALVSVLEGIPGVGAKRRKALLKALGSAEAVAAATVVELAAVPGIGPGMAEVIAAAFRPAAPLEAGAPGHESEPL